MSVSCSRWVLGREFKFSGRQASALTAKASPALRVTYYKGVDSSASFLPQICLFPGTAARESLFRKLSSARRILGRAREWAVASGSLFCALLAWLALS